MDGPIKRVEPPRILPLAGPGRAGERNGRGGQRFALDPDSGEVHEEAHEATDARPGGHDRSVGHADDDESGARVDVTA